VSADPSRIMELATAYWGSRCLLAANRLGVFRALAGGPLPAEALAARLDVAPRPARLLLRACVGLGLLEEDERGFANAPAAGTFLVPGSPAYLGDALGYAADMWDAWSGLERAVTEGRPALAAGEYTGQDPERTRRFVQAMHRRALGIGRALVSIVDLSGRKSLLDVGGGPGTYAALFTAACPGLRATVLDLPDVVALASAILAELGAGGRVETLAGDYHSTPFPAGRDVVLISGVLHRESKAGCRALIGRAREALEPGGLLVVADVFTDAGGATPAFAALFGVNMMLSAPDGGVHADADVARWMEEAGFRAVERRPFPPPMPHRVVLGTR
jgi:3-hydroxy-5-methyl-1-naphthoate 3-O-methyltransferase